MKFPPYFLCWGGGSVGKEGYLVGKEGYLVVSYHLAGPLSVYLHAHGAGPLLAVHPARGGALLTGQSPHWALPHPLHAGWLGPRPPGPRGLPPGCWAPRPLLAAGDGRAPRPLSAPAGPLVCGWAPRPPLAGADSLACGWAPRPPVVGGWPAGLGDVHVTRNVLRGPRVQGGVLAGGFDA